MAYFCKEETKKKKERKKEKGEMKRKPEKIIPHSVFAQEFYGLCKVQKCDKFR